MLLSNFSLIGWCGTGSGRPIIFGGVTPKPEPDPCPTWQDSLVKKFGAQTHSIGEPEPMPNLDFATVDEFMF